MTLIGCFNTSVEVVQHALVAHPAQHFDGFHDGIKVQEWQRDNFTALGRIGLFLIFAVLGGGLQVRHRGYDTS